MSAAAAPHRKIQPAFAGIPGGPVAPGHEAVRLPQDRIGRRLQISGYVSLGVNLFAVWGGAALMLSNAAPAAGGIGRGPVTMERWEFPAPAPEAVAEKAAVKPRVSQTPRRSGVEKVAKAAAGGGRRSSSATSRPTPSAATAAVGAAASLRASAGTPRPAAPAAPAATPGERTESVAAAAPNSSASDRAATPAAGRVTTPAAVAGGLSASVAPSLPGGVTAPAAAPSIARGAAGPLSVTGPTIPMGARPSAAGAGTWRDVAPMTAMETGVVGVSTAGRPGPSAPSLRPGTAADGATGSISMSVAPRTSPGGSGAADGAAAATREPLSGGTAIAAGPFGRRVAGGASTGGERTGENTGTPGGDGLGSSGVARSVGGPAARPGGSGPGGDGIAASGAPGFRTPGEIGAPVGVPGGRGAGGPGGDALAGTTAAPGGPLGRRVTTGAPGAGRTEGGEGNGPGAAGGLRGADRDGDGDGAKPTRRPGFEGGARATGDANVIRAKSPDAPKSPAPGKVPEGGKPIENTDKPRATTVVGERIVKQQDVTVRSRVEPQIPESLRGESINVTVRARFAVAADGSFTVSLNRSTGFPALDSAIRAAMNRWKFGPALEDGRPVCGVYEVTIQLRNE